MRGFKVVAKDDSQNWVNPLNSQGIIYYSVSVQITHFVITMA